MRPFLFLFVLIMFDLMICSSGSKRNTPHICTLIKAVAEDGKAVYWEVFKERQELTRWQTSPKTSELHSRWRFEVNTLKNQQKTRQLRIY